MSICIVSVPHSGTHWLKEKLGATKALHCDPGGGWRRAMAYGDIHVPLRDPLLSCITRKARYGADDERVVAACIILIKVVAPHVAGFHLLEGEPVNAEPPHELTVDDVPLAMEGLLDVKSILIPFYESHGVELSWA
jgi:hypothetical protein